MPSVLMEEFVDRAHAQAAYNSGRYDEALHDNYLSFRGVAKLAIDRVMEETEGDPELAEVIGADIQRQASPDGEITVVRTPFFAIEGVRAATRGKLLAREAGSHFQDYFEVEYALMLAPAATPYAKIDIDLGQKEIKYPLYPDLHRTASGHNPTPDLEVIRFSTAIAQGVENIFERRTAA